jgi:hypothetical protein
MSDFDDPILYQSQKNNWENMFKYWENNGNNFDWNGEPDPWGDFSFFLEYYKSKETYIGRHRIKTLEPCNYASNVALYHTLVSICNRRDEWTISTE